MAGAKPNFRATNISKECLTETKSTKEERHSLRGLPRDFVVVNHYPITFPFPTMLLLANGYQNCTLI
jgi:hypothetical protein